MTKNKKKIKGKNKYSYSVIFQFKAHLSKSITIKAYVIEYIGSLMLNLSTECPSFDLRLLYDCFQLKQCVHLLYFIILHCINKVIIETKLLVVYDRRAFRLQIDLSVALE